MPNDNVHEIFESMYQKIHKEKWKQPFDEEPNKNKENA